MFGLGSQLEALEDSNRIQHPDITCLGRLHDLDVPAGATMEFRTMSQCSACVYAAAIQRQFSRARYR